MHSPMFSLHFIQPDASSTGSRWVTYPTDHITIARNRYITSNDPRGYVPVIEYPLGNQVIMMDADDGYILWTSICKALGKTKADITKMVDSIPNLSERLRRVKGGFLKIQGTWIPHDSAKELARKIAWPIRHDLIPLFGPEFPEWCLSPSDPGYGQITVPKARKTARRAATLASPNPNPSANTSRPSLNTSAPYPTRPAGGYSQGSNRATSTYSDSSMLSGSYSQAHSTEASNQQYSRSGNTSSHLQPESYHAYYSSGGHYGPGDQQPPSPIGGVPGYPATESPSPSGYYSEGHNNYQYRDSYAGYGYTHPSSSAPQMYSQSYPSSGYNQPGQHMYYDQHYSKQRTDPGQYGRHPEPSESADQYPYNPSNSNYHRQGGPYYPSEQQRSPVEGPPYHKYAPQSGPSESHMRYSVEEGGQGRPSREGSGDPLGYDSRVPDPSLPSQHVRHADYYSPPQAYEDSQRSSHGKSGPPNYPYHDGAGYRP